MNRAFSLPEQLSLSPPLCARPARAGLLTEVHKFSKFLHGTAALFPDMVQVSCFFHKPGGLLAWFRRAQAGAKDIRTLRPLYPPSAHCAGARFACPALC